MKMSVSAFRFANRVKSKAYKLLYGLKYASFLDAQDSEFGEGLMVKPFYKKSSLLDIKLKKNRIGAYTLFQGSGQIRFDEGSFCGAFCVFGCNESIHVGKNVLISQAVTIRDTTHVFDSVDIPICKQGIKTAPVVIEDDVWLGHGATILMGVTVGTGAVVAAGAVVTRNVEAYSVVGGVPAKVLKRRK